MGLTRSLAVFVCLVYMGVAALPAAGQTEVGGASVNGTVMDPSGAVVAGAKVTLRNPETGLTQSVESSSAGLYFIKVPVGAYDVTVEASGFKKAEAKGVGLAVGSTLTLDFSLQVGAATESVDVTAETPVVETSRTSTSTGVSAQAVAELPVNGRNFIDFTTLTPGVVRDPTRGGDLTFGGQRGPANSLLVDGADSNNLFYAQATGRTGFRPYAFSQDAVQEFQVNANSFPAEVGRASGGAINVITKSGTNELHGSAFEFYRDKGLNANTLINNRTGAPKSPYHFNQFGGSVGGPIKRDKAFFFLNYDEQRNNSTQVLSPNSLPTAAQLPAFQKYLTPYSLGLENRVALAKVDLNLTDRDRISVRYNLSRYTGVNAEASSPSSAQEHTGNNEVNTDNIAAAYTRVIGNTMVWESRFNFVKDNEPGFANTTGPEVVIQNGLTFGANAFSPRFTNTKAYQPTMNLSIVHNRHTVKFGVDFNFLRADNYFPGNFAGSFTFNSYTDFLNNTPSRFVQGFSGASTTAPTSHPDVNEWAGFLQDSWRVSDRLTLNYGARYDYFEYRQGTTRNPNAGLLALGLNTAKLTKDPHNIAPRFGFAWRVTKSDRMVIRGGYGIYYARTSGLLLSTALLQNGIDVLTYTLTSGLPSYPNILATSPGAAAPPDIDAMMPNFRTGRTQQFSLQTELRVGRNSSLTVGYLGVNGSHLTRTRDINLFPEVPVTGFVCPTAVLCTTATGSPITYFRHDGTVPGISRPNPAFGRISVFESGGNSIYHGGFVQFSRRFANNFQVLTSYTFSKVVDSRPDNTAVVSGNPTDEPKLTQDSLNPNDDRGPEDADIRHKFVFSGVWHPDYAKNLQSRAARGLLNNWELSAISQLQSGRPFNSTVTGDPNADGNNLSDRVPGVGRNTVRGPEFMTVDVRVTRDIPLYRERVRLRLIGEAFNLTNRANINAIVTNRYTFSGGFYVPTTNYLFPTSVFDPRIFQLAAKITF